MGLYHGWDGDEDTHADFVRGGVSPDDFDAPVRHRKKSEKNRPKKKKGCPENDFGPHVYIWVPSELVYDWWPDYTDDFYEKNGFRVVGSHVFQLGADPQTDILMQKDVAIEREVAERAKPRRRVYQLISDDECHRGIGLAALLPTTSQGWRN